MTTLQFLLRYPIKAKRIKLAAGACCEVCGRAEALEDLEVHSFLQEHEDAYPPSTLEQFLLVLCTRCHWEMHTHEVPSFQQEALVRQRMEPVREEIRAILTYIPKPYIPPERDMEDAYREATEPHHFGFGV